MGTFIFTLVLILTSVSTRFLKTFTQVISWQATSTFPVKYLYFYSGLALGYFIQDWHIHTHTQTQSLAGCTATMSSEHKTIYNLVLVEIQRIISYPSSCVFPLKVVKIRVAWLITLYQMLQSAPLQFPSHRSGWHSRWDALITLLMQTELKLKGLDYWTDPWGAAAKKPGTKHCTGTVKTDLMHASVSHWETKQYSALKPLSDYMSNNAAILESESQSVYNV